MVMTTSNDNCTIDQDNDIVITMTVTLSVVVLFIPQPCYAQDNKTANKAFL